MRYKDTSISIQSPMRYKETSASIKSSSIQSPMRYKETSDSIKSPIVLYNKPNDIRNKAKWGYSRPLNYKTEQNR